MTETDKYISEASEDIMAPQVNDIDFFENECDYELAFSKCMEHYRQLEPVDWKKATRFLLRAIENLEKSVYQTDDPKEALRKLTKIIILTSRTLRDKRLVVSSIDRAILEAKRDRAKVWFLEHSKKVRLLSSAIAKLKEKIDESPLIAILRSELIRDLSLLTKSDVTRKLLKDGMLTCEGLFANPDVKVSTLSKVVFLECAIRLNLLVNSDKKGNLLRRALETSWTLLRKADTLLDRYLACRIQIQHYQLIDAAWLSEILMSNERNVVKGSLSQISKSLEELSKKTRNHLFIYQVYSALGAIHERVLEEDIQSRKMTWDETIAAREKILKYAKLAYKEVEQSLTTPIRLEAGNRLSVSERMKETKLRIEGE